MAKRFIDTELWEQEWYMHLNSNEKLAVLYIFSRCDCVGVWKPNITYAKILLGVDVDFNALLEKCNGNIEVLESGHWWLVDFCDFQYGQLNENCRPHASYIKRLQKYGLLQRVYKGYTKGIHTLKEQEQEKDKDKDKDKDKRGVGERLEISGYSLKSQVIDPSLWVMQKVELTRIHSNWSANRGNLNDFLSNVKQFMDLSDPDVTNKFEKAIVGYVIHLKKRWGDVWESKVKDLFFFLKEWENYYDESIEVRIV